MLLSVNFTVFAFFSVAVSFNPIFVLFVAINFLLSYVAVSRPCRLSEYFTLTSHHNNLYFPENNHGT